MLTQKTNIILVFILICIAINALGQSGNLDSLENILQKHHTQDTLRVNLLNGLAIASIRENPENTFSYASEACSLSDSIGFLQGQAKALEILGRFYHNTGDFNKAIKHFKESANISEQTGNRALQITTLSLLGRSYAFNGNMTAAIQTFEEVLATHREDKNLKGIASALNFLGNVSNMDGNMRSAESYYLEALQIMIEMDNRRMIALLNNNLGLIYSQQDKYYNAIDCYLEALMISEELGQKEMSAIILNGLGTIYYGLDEFEAAFEYHEKALELSEKLNDQSNIANCLNNMANIAIEKGEQEEAWEYYERAYTIFEELGMKSSMASVLGNQSIILKNKTEYTKAIEYRMLAIEIDEEIGNEAQFISDYQGLADIYIETNQLDKAEYYTLSGLKIAEKYNLLIYQINAHSLLSQIYELTKKYSKALQHQKQFKTLADSLINAEQIKKITGLEYKYQFDKEKLAIANLQKEKDAIQNEKYKRKTQQRNAFILGFALVLILAFVIYRYYLQKRKANKKLIWQNDVITKQNGEIELLLKEVHHRVKNNLQIITSLLDLQSVNIDNLETKATLLDAQSRLKSISLIHEVLSRNEKDAYVSFKDFVSQLAGHIKFSVRGEKQITVDLNIPDSYQFNIKTTIPLGLIINELLTNAFKYAFSSSESGTITINMSSNKNNEFILEIWDNGSGLPDGFDIKASTSLGLSLILTLCEQLSGKLKYKFDGGARFTLLFLEAEM